MAEIENQNIKNQNYGEDLIEESQKSEDKKQKPVHKKKIELLMEIEEKDAKIEGLQKQSNEYLDLAKRLKADFENYKKREQEERSQLKGIYQNEILLEFLSIFDNLERALKEEEKLKDGVLLIKKEFENILLKRGLTRIETTGCKFSPKLHTAILSIPTKDKESGMILEEVQSGWLYNELCLKPALVVVSKEWEEASEKGE